MHCMKARNVWKFHFLSRRNVVGHTFYHSTSWTIRLGRMCAIQCATFRPMDVSSKCWTIPPMVDSPTSRWVCIWSDSPPQCFWVLYIEQKLNNDQQSGWENQMSSAQTFVVGNWKVICQSGNNIGNSPRRTIPHWTFPWWTIVTADIHDPAHFYRIIPRGNISCGQFPTPFQFDQVDQR